MIKKSQPIRIAIAGLGFGESVHIPASISNENIELIGLWHPRPERLREALGIIRIMSGNFLKNRKMVRSTFFVS